MARIPFVTVTGFLGSGKTSLINALLAQRPAERILVMVNELGEIAVDHRLLSLSAGQTVVALPGGCLCCAYRGELGGRLRSVIDAGVEFDRIVIETSGLATPVGVERELMADPELAPRLKVGGVICCLDACDGAHQLDTFAEAQAQLALADHVVVTKTDLAGADPEAAERAARAWAPDAQPFRAPLDAAALAQIFAGSRPGPRPQGASGVTPGHSVIECFTVRPAALDIEQSYALIAAACAAAGETLLRLKGFLRPADSDRVFAVQAVSGLIYPLVETPGPDQPEAMLTLIGTRGLRAQLLASPEGRRLLDG